MADINTQIQQIEEQRRRAQAMASGEDERMAQAARYGLPAPTTTELNQEIKKYDSQIQFLKQYQAAEQRIKEAERVQNIPGYVVSQQDLATAKLQLEQNRPIVEAITSKELSPFVSVATGKYPEATSGSYADMVQRLGKEGDIRIDIRGAVQSGVPDDLLRQAGVKQVQIARAKQNLKTEKEWRKVDVESQKIIEARNAEKQATFMKENTKLPDGVYMRNEELDRLKKENPELHDILKRLGYKQAQNYIKRQEDAIKTIKKKAPDSITKDGVYLGVAMAAGVSEDTLVAAGFSREDIKASKPKTTDERFNDIAMVVFGKPYDKLSTKDKMKVGIQAQNIHDFSPDTMPAAVRIAVSMTPVMGTMYFWDEMDTSGKVLSVAGDILFFTAPYIIPRALSTIKGLTKADDIIKVYDQAMEITSKNLKKIAPDLVKPFKAVTAAQSQYADDLLWQSQLETIIKETDEIVKSGAITKGTKFYSSQITTAQRKVIEELLESSKAELAALQNRLPKEAADLKKTYDAWKIASKSEQTGDIVKYTESIVENASKRSAAAETAELESNLSKAQTALKQAYNKYPTAPEKWADLAQDVAEAEVKLKAAQLGDAIVMQKQLTTAREMIPKLEKMLYGMRETDTYYEAVEEALKTARKLADDLPKEIDKYITSLEVEWGRGGGIPTKGGFTATMNKNPILSGLSGTTESELASLARRATGAQIARLLGLAPLEDVKSKKLPDVKPYKGSEVAKPVTVSDLTRIRIINSQGKTVSVPIISTVPLAGIIPELKAEPATGTKSETSTKISEEIKPSEAVEAKVQPVTETETSTKTGTRTKTGEKVEATAKTKYGPIRIGKSEMSDADKRQAIIDADGAIAWRMGKIGGKDRWDVVIHPYQSNEDYVMVLGKAPEGATIVRKGKGSAYGTTQVIRGKAPKSDVDVDSGFVDITLTPVGKISVKMKVTPDPKLETRGDITIGRRMKRITPKIPKIK